MWWRERAGAVSRCDASRPALQACSWVHDQLSISGPLPGVTQTPLPPHPPRPSLLLDQHYGELTVRQTLKFSARVQGGRKGA